MEWALSEKMFEELLLTEGWTQMSDADMDTFLITPNIETIEAITTEEHSNVNEQNDIVQANDTNPVVEDKIKIVGINEEVEPGSLEEDSFEFFNNVGSDNEFIIFHDIFNYEDSRYDHVYMSRFDEDSFF